MTPKRALEILRIEMAQSGVAIPGTVALMLGEIIVDRVCRPTHTHPSKRTEERGKA